MKLDLESMIGVARRSYSSTSKIASQAQVYLMKHYHYYQTNMLTPRHIASFIKHIFQHCLSNILITQTYNTCVHSAPAFLRLYNHMKNMQQRTVFALLVIVVTTVLPHCLVSHIWFPIFLTGSKQLTNVSSPLKIPFEIVFG